MERSLTMRSLRACLRATRASFLCRLISSSRHAHSAVSAASLPPSSWLAPAPPPAAAAAAACFRFFPDVVGPIVCGAAALWLPRGWSLIEGDGGRDLLV